MKTTKWAIHNQKNPPKDLVADLRNLTDDLERISRSAVTIRRQRIIVDYEIASVKDEGSLQSIEDATGTCTSLLSETASIRLSQIRRDDNNTNNDHSSDTTFWSAYTHVSKDKDLGKTNANVLTYAQQQLQSVTQAHRLGQGFELLNAHDLTDLRPEPTVSTAVLQRQPVWCPYEDVSAYIEDVAEYNSRGSILFIRRQLPQLMEQGMASTWRFGLSRVDTIARALVCFFERARHSPHAGGIFYLQMFVCRDCPFKTACLPTASQRLSPKF